MNFPSTGWRYGLAFVATLAIAPLASAGPGDREGSWETRLGIIFNNSANWDFDGGTTAKINSDSSLLFGISYHYTDNFEFGANLNFGQTDYQANIIGDVASYDVHGHFDNT